MLVSPEEYLAAERVAEFRSEYVDGQVYAMAGTSVAHNRITKNILRSLERKFGEGPCEAFVSEVRVRTKLGGPYYYPDVFVVCGEPEYEDGVFDTLLNAKIVIEILSPSTEDYDRGKKFAYYRKLPSLTEYLLIRQDRVNVEHYVKQAEGHWSFSETTDIDGVIDLPSVGANLKVADIYHRVLP